MDCGQCICISLTAKVAQKFNKVHCTIVQGILSKMARKEFSIFIFFSDAYTCSYVV